MAQIHSYQLNFSVQRNPADMGMDTQLLLKYGENLKQNFPACKQMMVTRKGQLVFQFVNSHPQVGVRMTLVELLYKIVLPFFPRLRDSMIDSRLSSWNTRSVTKNILSAITGIALNKGIIRDLNHTLRDFLDNVPMDKRTITLKQLLTMTSGLPFTDNAMVMSSWLRSANWIEHILKLPLEASPGSRFVYSTANSHLLAAILNKQLKGQLRNFTQKELFEPLDFGTPYWETDPQGTPFGGANLFLTIEDMLKFGYLYLQEGRWNNKQMIPQKWVQDSITPFIHAADHYEYGYYWWLRSFQVPHQNELVSSFCAAGVGGQRIHVIPKYEIVMAGISRTSLFANTEILDNLIEQFILPAIQF